MDGQLEFVGTPLPPAANEAGWKDTAFVYPSELLTIIVRFDGYTGRYVCHCHMLEHEDKHIMRPYPLVFGKASCNRPANFRSREEFLR